MTPYLYCSITESYVEILKSKCGTYTQFCDEFVCPRVTEKSIPKSRRFTVIWTEASWTGRDRENVTFL
jgi:hypothetical protein